MLTNELKNRTDQAEIVYFKHPTTHYIHRPLWMLYWRMLIHTPNNSLVSAFSLWTDTHKNSKRQQCGITVAGGNRQGNGINQLSNPCGLYVDNGQTIYVAEWSNHRIMEWKRGATSGQVVAGGNGQGSGDHQLDNPQDVIIDKERDSLIICDYSNRRV
ncbi:unnamed protein product, partial [Rotaria sp. Silwood1]